MRISELNVVNFRGVRSATLDDVDQRGLVVLSGRNGVGKSLCLLAVALAWEEHIGDIEQHVGPWGANASVTVTLQLLDSERLALEDYHRRRTGRDPEESCPSSISLGHVFNDTGVTERFKNPRRWAALLTDKVFGQLHSFAHIDLIPAERSLHGESTSSIDLRTLAVSRADDLRQSALQSLLGLGSFSMYGVADYLATLDYLDLMRHRLKGGPSDAGYDAISDGFFAATGKRIERPRPAADESIAIFVRASSENSHALSLLSSGERETLALMYLVRRLEARGGILLVDEPELHLHPALQTAILDLLEADNQRAQLWLCTHSPSLIAAADPESLVVVAAPKESQSQISWVTSEMERVSALADLGMTPGAWLQADYILIVEGSGDKQMLSGLLPAEISRAVIYVAGTKSAVHAVARTLAGSDGLLPWVAIADRDIANSDKYAESGIVMWSRRMIENLLLDPPLLAAAVTAAGGDMTEQAARSLMEALSVDEIEDVVRLTVEEELKARHSAARKADGRNLTEWYEAEAQVAAERLSDLAEVEAAVRADILGSWKESWPNLVNGKRMLAKIAPSTPFRSKADLVNGLIRACRSQEELLPPDIADLRRRIAEVLPAPPIKRQ
jgi:putative AbiEii toxin of type IV toxin-antitoxin system